jgi:hypothetical protein
LKNVRSLIKLGRTRAFLHDHDINAFFPDVAISNENLGHIVSIFLSMKIVTMTHSFGATVPITELRNCKLAFQCDQEWQTLDSTSEGKDIKYCNICDRNVYFCNSNEELAEAVKNNRCIAIKNEYNIEYGPTLMGSPMIEYPGPA